MLDDNFDSENPAQWLDDLLSPEVAEGAVFLAGQDKSVIDILAQTPETHREKLQQLLQQFQDSVFKECEFPPFPPHRDVEFKIQLAQAAQMPAAGVHKLSPALVEQLCVMLQELLHNGLIIPTCSSQYAAPLLMVKKPDGGYRVCIDYRKLNAVTVKKISIAQSCNVV